MSINTNSNYLESRCIKIARKLAIAAPELNVSPIFDIQAFNTKQRDDSVIQNYLGDAVSIYLEGNGTGVAKLNKIEVSKSSTFASDIYELDAGDYQPLHIADYKAYTQITNTEISRKLGIKTSVFGNGYRYVRVTTQVVSATGFDLEVKFDINPSNY